MQINAVGMNTLANNSNALSVNPKFSATTEQGTTPISAGPPPPPPTRRRTANRTQGRTPVFA